MKSELASSTTQNELPDWAATASSSSITKLISRVCNPELHHHASTDQIRRLSNWQANMFEELQRTIYLMFRLPEEHDLHLDPAVAWRASEILGWIKSNTDAEAPRIINEDGDTLMFTWDEGALKKYLCIDDSEIEIEARRKGAPYVASEVVGHSDFLDVKRLTELLGLKLRSDSAA